MPNFLKKRQVSSSSSTTNHSKRIKSTPIEKDAKADDDGYESDSLDIVVGDDDAIVDNEEEEDDDFDDDEEDDNEEEGLNLELPEPSSLVKASTSRDDGIDKISNKKKGKKDKVDKDDEEDDEEVNGEPVMINVDFSFKDPHEIDFKSIRRLLTNYVPAPLISDQTSTSLEESIFDASGMAECIVAQRVLGTMIKIDDDLDVYSFATILPVSRYRESLWMRSIKSFVLDHCKDIKKKKLLNDLFTGSSLGLMINERMLNVPAELSPVLVENLERDLLWVKNESALKEDRSIFSALTHILLLAPCWTDVTPKTTASSSVIAKSNFLHFEEEIFAKESVIDFEVNDISTTTTSTTSSSSKGSSSLRRPQSKRVIVMPLSVLTKCVTETKRLVEIAEEEEKESTLQQQISISAKNPSKKKQKKRV